MTKGMRRKGLVEMKKIAIWATLLLFLVAVSIGTYLLLGLRDVTKAYPQEAALFVPELIDSREADQKIELVIREGRHAFFEGIESPTRGFNYDFLGPTIRLYTDDTTQIRFVNDIGEPTTVHGHGLLVDGELDGGPQSEILPGTTHVVSLPIVQEAGTSWYHPHLMGKTADHVHEGLAGLYLIEDQNSLSLPLPRDYGVNDLPLIVQDRTFVDGKMQPYKPGSEDLLDGLREETLIVNGTVNAYHEVPTGWVRLRLLNASNARFYRFFFTEEETFYKIATEGGFLERPIALNEITMAPGERNEIMIDLSDGDDLSLMAEFLPADPDDALWFFSNPVQSVVRLQVDPVRRSDAGLPDKLNTIVRLDEEDLKTAVRRTINLDMDEADDGGPISANNAFSINGEAMDMAIINERVKRGDLELWTVTGDMMPHPFHVHGVSFQILTHNGEETAMEDRGWKDTLVISEEPSQILMRFNHVASQDFPYMYHCHIFEHEDAGMMGQFTVTD